MTRNLINPLLCKTGMGEARPKGIDLFAGPGGLSLGLTLSGFDIVGAVEWDSDAGATYRHNMGDHVHVGDIKDHSPKEMERQLKAKGSIRRKREIVLVSGGPPCPGFSLMGRSKIANLIETGEWEGSDSRHAFIDDPRNQLFREFVAYVAHFKPKYFLMENVKGMVSYKNQQEIPIITVIKKEFETLGYTVEAKVLTASEYGVPQDRQRVIFLGTKGKRQRIRYPEPMGISISLRDALKDLPLVSPSTGLSVDEKLALLSKIGLSDKGRFIRWVRSQKTPRGNQINSRECTLHHTRPVNPRDQAIFPLLTSGENSERILYKDIYPSRLDEVEKLLPLGYELKRYKTVPPKVIGPPWGQRKTKRWKWYDPSKFGDKMRRMRGDKPAPTMVAHLAKDGYMFIHPDEDRTITVREAARFQSFPDSYDFSAGGQNSVSSQFRQVGNAVPPLMAMALGEQIMSALGLEASLTVSEVYRRDRAGPIH